MVTNGRIDFSQFDTPRDRLMRHRRQASSSAVQDMSRVMLWAPTGIVNTLDDLLANNSSVTVNAQAKLGDHTESGSTFQMFATTLPLGLLTPGQAHLILGLVNTTISGGFVAVGIWSTWFWDHSDLESGDGDELTISSLTAGQAYDIITLRGTTLIPNTIYVNQSANTLVNPSTTSLSTSDRELLRNITTHYTMEIFGNGYNRELSSTDEYATFTEDSSVIDETITAANAVNTGNDITTPFVIRIKQGTTTLVDWTCNYSLVA